MAYIHKHTWINDSEPDIDADNLNEIEEGIENAADKADEAYSIATTNESAIRTLKGKVSDNEGYIIELTQDKADKSTTYTKSEVNGLLSAKADSSSLGTVSAINLNNSTEQYLRGDGTWQTVQGGGTNITIETSGNGPVISEISANGSVITQTKTANLDGNIYLGGTIMKADGSDYVQSYIDEALGDIGTVLDAINGISV